MKRQTKGHCTKDCFLLSKSILIISLHQLTKVLEMFNRSQSDSLSIHAAFLMSRRGYPFKNATNQRFTSDGVLRDCHLLWHWGSSYWPRWLHWDSSRASWQTIPSTSLRSLSIYSTSGRSDHCSIFSTSLKLGCIVSVDDGKGFNMLVTLLMKPIKSCWTGRSCWLEVDTS